MGVLSLGHTAADGRVQSGGEWYNTQLAAAHQSCPPGLRTWAGLLNCLRFNKANCWVLNLGHNNPMQHYKLRMEWMETCLVEKELRVLANSS